MKNEILLAGDSYQDNKIVSGTVVMVQSLDGNELQYDTLDATLDLGTFVPTIFKPADADGVLTSDFEILGVRPLLRVLVADPSAYKYGAEVLYKHNGNLVGKYYMSNLTRVGKTQYRITCVSPVGLLANSQHYGGIYSGIKFSELVSEIIGGVVPFSIASELQNQAVYGWLPVATRRDNLHQALFAMGAAAQKDANGNLAITALSDEARIDISDSRVYISGSVKYPDAVTKVSISEHTFVANDSDETVTLFEGTVSSERITSPKGSVVQGTVVLFNEPMHDLVVSAGSIIEQTVNYAVLGPSAECKLTGKKYTHTVRQVTRPETATGGDTDTENKITVTDATLISIANSENVADRLMSYYSSAKTASIDFVVENEKAGSAIQFTDPFGDRTEGIIKSMDINMSSTLKASAEVISDYSPGGVGNFYNNLDVVSQNGSWTVPSGVTKIRVAVIGGGDGGEGGADGEKGGTGPYYTSIMGAAQSKKYSGDPGNGGAGGKGGKGGKVFVSTLNVNAGETYPIVIGAAGKGASYGGTPTKGGNTIFGSLTSASGTQTDAGFASLFDSEKYAMSGDSGVSGGRGQEANISGLGGQADRPTITYQGQVYTAGSSPDYKIGQIEQPTLTAIVAVGGSGGGAAAGVNGADGAEGTIIINFDKTGAAIGGNGAKGATPIAAKAATAFGAGGHGGHGGGGGGGGGCAIAYDGLGGSGGAGGNGGAGGDGVSGCVLIYY